MLEFIHQEPTRIWFAKDFQNGDKFIGYEAGPRLCDLVNTGHMESLGRCNEKWEPGGKYTGYRLLTEVVVKKYKRQPTKKELIRAAFIAGRNTINNPKIGMFISAEDLADEYLQGLEF